MTIKTSITAAASVAAGAVLTTALAAFAQGGAATSVPAGRPVPTQACVQAIAANMAMHLAEFDAEQAEHKLLMQTHQSALAEAGAIADDAARQAAFQKAHEDFHAAMKSRKDANKEDRQSSRDSLKTACGDSIGQGKGMLKGPGNKGFGGKMMGRRGM